MEKHNTNHLYIMRFFAAFLILVYHFSPITIQYKYHFRNLDEAVNFFFFISGFVMVVSNKAYFEKSSAGLPGFDKNNYWVKRIARIYPSYFLALILVVVFNYTIKFTYTSIPPRFPFELLGIQRWVYGGSINFPAWTVSSEFFFYLLFPFTISWLSKTSIAKLAIIVIVLFIINVVITSIVGFVFVGNPHSKMLNMLTGYVYRHPVFEYTIFLLGNLLGVCYVRNIKFGITGNYKNALLCLLSLFVILGILYFVRTPQYPLIAAGILSPLYFIFVFSLCGMKGMTIKILSKKIFIFLGEISFSIYIFQIPIMLFFDHYNGTGKTELAYKSIGGFFAYAIVLISFCCINYYIFEKPLKNIIIKMYKKNYNKFSISGKTL